MVYIVDGEVVDTYGGDFTYRDVWYDIVDGEYLFFEMYYGAKSSEPERILDESRIKQYMNEIKNRVNSPQPQQ